MRTVLWKTYISEEEIKLFQTGRWEEYTSERPSWRGSEGKEAHAVVTGGWAVLSAVSRFLAS